jgi:long-subunit fatty acid transport protein
VQAELRPLLRAAAILVLVVGDPSPASAQASLQVPLQFDFTNPGARSLALGSAFVGLADDATSAFTNPAGLMNLDPPEVSFEIRGRDLESPFLLGGRLSGPLSRIGIDTEDRAVYGQSVASSTGLSYLSFAWKQPTWAIAGYRHEVVRLSQQFEANGVFQGEGTRELALRARRDIDIIASGVSAAYQVWQTAAPADPAATPRPARRITLGAGLTFYTFDLDGVFGRYVSPFYGAPTFEPRTEIGHAEQTADNVGVGFNVGALLTLHEDTTRMARGPDLVQVGIVYRKSPRFSFEAFEGSIDEPVQRNGTFGVPSVVGAGLAVRLTEKAAVTGEVTWVGYESLLDGWVSAQSVGSGRVANFTMDDGVELHAGIEYVLPKPVRWPLALRTGVWRDPDHAIKYAAPTDGDEIDERFAAYLPGGKDLTHFTFGGGVTISRQLQVNAGADFSSRTTVVSVSAVVQFVKRTPVVKPAGSSQ